MNRFCVAAAVAAASMVAPAAGLSQTTRTEQVTLEQWGQRVGAELSRHVRYPMLIGDAPFATGVARVKFNCSDSGRPDKVTLLRRSGSAALDRQAVAAVRRIATLHPLPAGLRHDQQYQAIVLFALDQDEHDAQMRSIRAEAKKANGWFKGESIAAAGAPIVIGG